MVDVAGERTTVVDNNHDDWLEKSLGSWLIKYDKNRQRFVEYATSSSVFRCCSLVDGDRNNDKKNGNSENGNDKNNNDDVLNESATTIVVGLYFTPMQVRHDEDAGKYLNEDILSELLELYAKINNQQQDGCTTTTTIDDDNDAKRFQIVQVCFQDERTPPDDRNSVGGHLKKQFDGLLINVPWFALPYSNYERRARLRCRYGVRDEEFALVLLDARTGNVINKQGHSKILQDPAGNKFPWYQPHVFEILSNVSRYVACNQNDSEVNNAIGNISSSNGSSKHFEELEENSVFGIYFSANWCPPCKAFTNQLIKTYKSIVEAHGKFQIIFVSSDRSEESYNQYRAMMPWLAIAYEDVASRKHLTEYYGVKGIPTLIILNADGSVITEDGRGEINDDPYGQNFPWYPKLVNVLTDRLAAKLHNHPTLVLFIDGEEEGEIELAETVLYPISEYVKKNFDEISLQFFIAVDSESSENLREYIQLEDVTPLVTIIDMPLSRFFIMEYGKDITEQSIMDFVNGFIDGKLASLPIRRKPY